MTFHSGVAVSLFVQNLWGILFICHTTQMTKAFGIIKWLYLLHMTNVWALRAVYAVLFGMYGELAVDGTLIYAWNRLSVLIIYLMG